MTLWNKILVALWLIPSIVSGQDLYSFDNSLKFADHLFRENEFEAAANEYSRAVFLNPECTTCYINYVISLRRSNQLDKAISVLNKTRTLGLLTGNLEEEWLKVYSLNSDYEGAVSFVEKGLMISEETSGFYLLAISLKRFDLSSANTIMITDNPDDWKYHRQTNQLFSLRDRANDIRFKKKFLAGLYSMFIPGMGKVYTGYKKDALVSFVLTGLAIWQSYRGFSMKGTNSVLGWTYGAIGLGLYTGNIYGSVKSANKRNEQYRLDIQQTADHVLLSIY